MSTTVVIDVGSLGTRAFYTGLSSFWLMVYKISKESPSANFIFAFDGKNNWRKTVYPPYKATRKSEDREAKIAYFRTLWYALKHTNHVCLYHDELEADDIMANIAIKQPTVIVTSDKDAFGLINEQTKVYYVPKNFMGRYLVGPKEFEEIYGFSSDLFFTWKALVGDRGDNIPGVHGVGPVAATALVKKYGNNVLNIPPNDIYSTKIKRGLNTFLLAKTLVTPKYINMTIPFGSPYNHQGAYSLWQTLK